MRHLAECIRISSYLCGSKDIPISKRSPAVIDVVLDCLTPIHCKHRANIESPPSRDS
jgi:hypothetical protein